MTRVVRRKSTTRAATKATAEGAAKRSGAPERGDSDKEDARSRKAAAKREAILHAALDEFSARGFTAARLEDVAARAGVAKGTIYLYFADKEALFQEIVRALIVPVLAFVEVTPPPGMPIRKVLEGLIQVFVHQVYSTRRRDVIQLMISEGGRF